MTEFFTPASSPHAQAEASGVSATSSDGSGPSTDSHRPRIARNDAQRSSVRTVSRWERIAFSIVHGFGVLCLRALGLTGLWHFARAFGTIEWTVNFKRRRRFAAALHDLFGESPSPSLVRTACREHFMQTRCERLFYLVFDAIPRRRMDRIWSVNDPQLFDRLMTNGRGLYAAFSHHGPQFTIGLMMAFRGFKTAGVRDRREGGVRRFIEERYAKKYPELQRTLSLYPETFAREIFRCLQDGYALGSAMDVHRSPRKDQKTIEVQYFGRPQTFLAGPIWIALRCRVPIVQAFMTPLPGFRYRLELELLADPSDAPLDHAAAVPQIMQRYADNIERRIRQQPGLITRI